MPPRGHLAMCKIFLVITTIQMVTAPQNNQPAQNVSNAMIEKSQVEEIAQESHGSEENESPFRKKMTLVQLKCGYQQRKSEDKVGKEAKITLYAG